MEENNGRRTSWLFLKSELEHEEPTAFMTCDSDLARTSQYSVHSTLPSLSNSSRRWLFIVHGCTKGVANVSIDRHFYSCLRCCIICDTTSWLPSRILALRVQGISKESACMLPRLTHVKTFFSDSSLSVRMQRYYIPPSVLTQYLTISKLGFNQGSTFHLFRHASTSYRGGKMSVSCFSLAS